MVQVGKSIILVHGFVWSAYTEDFLEELRRVRDKVDNQELCHAFNEACDRLDVLNSKLRAFEKADKDEWIVFDCDLGGPFILKGDSHWAEQIENQKREVLCE